MADFIVIKDGDHSKPIGVLHVEDAIVQEEFHGRAPDLALIPEVWYRQDAGPADPKVTCFSAMRRQDVDIS